MRWRKTANLRGVSKLMVDLVDNPEWLEELLERCVEVEIAFAGGKVEAGADIIGLGDAVASLVSPQNVPALCPALRTTHLRRGA